MQTQQKLEYYRNLFNNKLIQKGGGVDFNIFLGHAICLNVDQLTPSQSTQIHTLIESLTLCQNIIYDTYNEINWILFPTSPNEIPRIWFRFPLLIQTQENKNKNFEENQLNIEPSFCLRLDEDQNEDKKMYIKDETIMKTFYENLNDKKLSKQFQKFFNSIDQKCYMTGKWLCLSYS